MCQPYVCSSVYYVLFFSGCFEDILFISGFGFVLPHCMARGILVP